MDGRQGNGSQVEKRPSLKTCPVCSSHDFTTSARQRRYCGPTCAAAAAKARREWTPTVSCAVCATEFRRSAGGRVYCSTACRREGRRRQNRAWERGRARFRSRLPPDVDRPDLYADGWEKGREDALRDLRAHLPHDGDPCDLCDVLMALTRRGQGVPEGQNTAPGPGDVRL